VLLDDLLDLLLLQVLKLIFLEVETELATTTERRIDGVSVVMVKVPPAADSQIYCSSSCRSQCR
jgi:hypothetical protein